MSMSLTTKRKQEAQWSLHFSRNIAAYRDNGWSYTSFMEACRFNGRPPDPERKRT
jgi:hypothetical protein